MSRSEADVQDLRMMERCLELARQGVKQGELPFGVVIASRGQVIAEATNRVSSECDVTRHAELAALSEAQKILRRKRLPHCTLYSIVEPCPMCSFPAREARIGRVVFAISSPVMGGFSKWDESWSQLFGQRPRKLSGFLPGYAEGGATWFAIWVLIDR
ncbi:nucleoside deaminase [Bradyrhizobium sp. 2S1]|uniref:nucleoside deaminase n=1 Tax=Bradyrhizobium sp. 2S1 TaxID=1404429 RepID=UPI00140DD136|nr:nucleoside deaminase [Bradyrhizobium sp. 2S1]MCK7666179.1 nucleoside deaminase [Bradyrhizobium sp. 2S1]